MRIFMFRAWDKGTKEWIDKDFHLMGESLMAGLLVYNRPLERFNDVVITQYTGLDDEKGKYIYEGDILFAFLNKGRYIVKFGKWECPKSEFADFHFGVYLERQDSNPMDEGLDSGNHFEVIGNIFEGGLYES